MKRVRPEGLSRFNFHFRAVNLFSVWSGDKRIIRSAEDLCVTRQF
jgi:hypothetical protein